ncbi:MAG: nucleoside-diphosphate sugar epimerase/dehydratase [Micropepsaceae bacterium]
MTRQTVENSWAFLADNIGPRATVLVFDTLMAGLAFFLSIRFAVGAGFKWAGLKDSEYYVWSTISFAIISSIVFVLNNLHKGVWQFTSFRDLKNICRCAALTVLAFLPYSFLISRGLDLPRSSIFLAFALMTVFLAAPRVMFRMIQERGLPFLAIKDLPDRIPLYLVGVGARTESFIRETNRDRNSPYVVRGLVAPSAYWLHREVQGVPVVSTIDGLSGLVEQLLKTQEPVQRVVIADDGLSQGVKDQLLALTSEHGISLGRLPASTEIRDAQATGSELKPVVLEDLLHRPQKRLDRKAMRSLIEGRRILITGAGGSIGSELVRQVASFQPAHLSLIDNCEFNLYTIDQELEQAGSTISRRSILCDVRERRRVAQTFDTEKPDIVFHAAAYKHVPLVEQNPLEGVRTNVIGTRNVADEAVRHGAQAMVMISTDKAVNPTNVMGATKRLAEAYAQALDLDSSKTRFVTVRFGNVLGSTGSVVPLFQKQIASGGPVTVTHPDITRYFMTIPEAVQLVLQASVCGGESDEYRGKLFVLDMGEPVKIVDLARQMIRLAGKRPDVDVAIKYVGLRPGEKLHEELLHARERLVESPHAGLLLAAPRAGILQFLSRDIDMLETAVANGDEETALRLLKRTIPEFQSEFTPSALPPRERRLTLVRS